MKIEGVKHDGAKPRYDLLPPLALSAVASRWHGVSAGSRYDVISGLARWYTLQAPWHRRIDALARVTCRGLWLVSPDFGHALLGTVRVLEFGARKYAEGNWRYVDDARRRYYRAAVGHLSRIGADDESEEPHWAHAACCLLFLLELEYARTRI